jgi:hypothetical protein
MSSLMSVTVGSVGDGGLLFKGIHSAFARNGMSIELTSSTSIFLFMMAIFFNLSNLQYKKMNKIAPFMN